VATVGGRIALAAMGDRPLRARAAEEALAAGLGVDAAAQRAAEGYRAHCGSSPGREYRAHLARVLTRRALRSAAV
jgi:carbon-monoxide dehydrogenase medium subunit